MTDEQKLNFLLTELKIASLQQTCYDMKGEDYDYPEDLQECFEDGESYGWITFARGLLRGVSYD